MRWPRRETPRWSPRRTCTLAAGHDARSSPARSPVGRTPCRCSSPTTGAPDRSAPHERHAPGACTRISSGSGRACNRNPGSPGCLPGRRPDLRRSDRGGGLDSPSELGGFDEFCEFFPSRASNSPIRAPNSAISRSRFSNARSRSSSSANSCSTVGAAGTGDTGGTSATRTCLRGKSQSRTPQASRSKREDPRRRAEGLNGYSACRFAYSRPDFARPAGLGPHRSSGEQA